MCIELVYREAICVVEINFGKTSRSEEEVEKKNYLTDDDGNPGGKSPEKRTRQTMINLLGQMKKVPQTLFLLLVAFANTNRYDITRSGIRSESTNCFVVFRLKSYIRC